MKTVATYGLLAGVVSIGLMLIAMIFISHSLVLGYVAMLTGLAFIFIGVRRYRDTVHGGIVRFAPAFAMGAAIALVAGIAYVLVWEVYLAATDYRFMDDYIASLLRDHRAAGASAASLAKETAELETLRVQYRDPLFRMPMTFLEVAPVGLLVALVSALLLRNPRVLPATH